MHFSSKEKKLNYSQIVKKIKTISNFSLHWMLQNIKEKDKS